MLVPLLAGPSTPTTIGNARKSMLASLLDGFTAAEVTVAIDAIIVTAIEFLTGGPASLFVVFAGAGACASTGPERMLSASWVLFVGIREVDCFGFDGVACRQWKPNVSMESIDSRDHGIPSETMQVPPAWERKPVVVRRVKEVSRVRNRRIVD